MSYHAPDAAHPVDADAADTRVRSAQCGDVIGVYEPMSWMLADRTMIDGALRTRPTPSDAGSALHRDCARLAALLTPTASETRKARPEAPRISTVE
jgi:hypothetical protein